MWDEQIDEAARHMTAGEPTAGFTARVLARIDQRQQARWRRAWLVAPLAAAAIVVLAVVMWPQPAREVRRSPEEVRVEPDPTSEVRLKADTTPTATSEVRLKADTTTTSPTNEVSAGSQGPALQRARRSGPSAAAEEPFLQIGDVVEPPPSDLAVDAIAIEPIEIRVADLENMPVDPALVVDDMTIEPLDAASVSQ